MTTVPGYPISLHSLSTLPTLAFIFSIFVYLLLSLQTCRRPFHFLYRRLSFIHSPLASLRFSSPSGTCCSDRPSPVCCLQDLRKPCAHSQTARSTPSVPASRETYERKHSEEAENVPDWERWKCEAVCVNNTDTITTWCLSHWHSAGRGSQENGLVQASFSKKQKDKSWHMTWLSASLYLGLILFISWQLRDSNLWKSL